MKKRNGFVSNSSSSSFVIIETDNNKEILRYGDDDESDVCGSFTLPIDELIKQLLEAKESGATTITVSYGE